MPSVHKIQVGHTEGAQDDAAGFQATMDAEVKAALAGRKSNEGDVKQAACNSWDYTGTCSYGDRCRFSHDAEAGYKGTNTGVRIDADKDTQMAIAAFAAEKGHLMHDVTIGMIEADGGIQKWKLDFEEKSKSIKARTPEIQAIGWKRWSTKERKAGARWVDVASLDEE